MFTVQRNLINAAQARIVSDSHHVYTGRVAEYWKVTVQKKPDLYAVETNFPFVGAENSHL